MAKKNSASGSPSPQIRCAHSDLADPRTLKPHPENPNVHPKKQLAIYQQIIEFNGWRRPITISRRSGFVVKGHGALKTALRAGWESVPVDYQDYDTENAEIADLLADNELARQASMDAEILGDIGSRLLEADFNIELTGFTREKLDDICNPKKPFQPKSDEDGDIFTFRVTCKSPEGMAEIMEELEERGFICKKIGRRS